MSADIEPTDTDIGIWLDRPAQYIDRVGTDEYGLGGVNVVFDPHAAGGLVSLHEYRPIGHNMGRTVIESPHLSNRRGFIRALETGWAAVHHAIAGSTAPGVRRAYLHREDAIHFAWFGHDAPCLSDDYDESARCYPEVVR